MDHKEEQEENKKETVENRLRELREQIEKMEKENQALYDDLGLAPHQLQELLSDRTRYSQKSYDFIQRERAALEEILDRRINELRKDAKRETPTGQIRGHWIFVR
jgi:predicted RNase H-like nuclease (RuvC/YqgF family)